MVRLNDLISIGLFMDNFFKKNIVELRSRTPRLDLLENRLSENITVQQTVSGSLTIKYGEHFIHSSYDPIKEGFSFSKSVKPGNRIFLYGFGLGYHIKPILDRIGPEGLLLVVELNPEILSAAMILLDQVDLLSHKQLQLIFGKDEVEIAAEISIQMQSFQKAPNDPNSQVLFYSPSFKCIPKHFEHLSNVLEILLIERRVPAVFGDLENQNYSFNKGIINQGPGIKSLRGKHQNHPAVLISAGPSFDDIIPYLGEIQANYIDATIF